MVEPPNPQGHFAPLELGPIFGPTFYKHHIPTGLGCD